MNEKTLDLLYELRHLGVQSASVLYSEDGSPFVEGNVTFYPMTEAERIARIEATLSQRQQTELAAMDKAAQKAYLDEVRRKQLYYSS